MNSVASVVKAFAGSATPIVRPPQVVVPEAPVAVSGTIHVSKVIPVLLSVKTVGVLDCP